jgi:hypothetical protein
LQAVGHRSARSANGVSSAGSARGVLANINAQHRKSHFLPCCSGVIFQLCSVLLRSSSPLLSSPSPCIPLLSLTRLCASNPATRVDSEKKYRVCEMAWLSSLQSYTGACAGCYAFVIGSIARRLPCVRQSMASTQPWPTPTIGHPTLGHPNHWLAMASIEPCLRVFPQGSLPLWMADTAGV